MHRQLEYYLVPAVVRLRPILHSVELVGQLAWAVHRVVQVETRSMEGTVSLELLVRSVTVVFMETPSVQRALGSASTISSSMLIRLLAAAVEDMVTTALISTWVAGPAEMDNREDQASLATMQRLVPMVYRAVSAQLAKASTFVTSVTSPLDPLADQGLAVAVALAGAAVLVVKEVAKVALDLTAILEAMAVLAAMVATVAWLVTEVQAVAVALVVEYLKSLPLVVSR
jgi:hypothetical protein